MVKKWRVRNMTSNPQKEVYAHAYIVCASPLLWPNTHAFSVCLKKALKGVGSCIFYIDLPHSSFSERKQTLLYIYSHSSLSLSAAVPKPEKLSCVVLVRLCLWNDSLTELAILVPFLVKFQWMKIVIWTVIICV